MANEKRLIKADPIYNGILIYMASNAYLNDTALDVLKMVAKWIEEAPTVKVVHGHWIFHKVTIWGLWDKSFYECSNCGSRNPLFNFNYCPNCGAKMDGDGNG